MAATEEKTRQQLLADKIATASQRSLAIQTILVLSAFVGLCGSIYPILKSLGVSDGTAYAITAIPTVLVVIVVLGFFFIDAWKVYLVRATIVLLFSISVVLCGLLYWVYFVKVDEWVAWGDKVTEEVERCERAYKEAQAKRERPENYDEKVECVGAAIKEKYPHEGEEDSLKIVSLGNDLRAGSFLMRNAVVYDVLRTKLGIGEKFLGTGLAVPSNGGVYGDARLPEYLVPNLPEKSDKILTWQISPIVPNTSKTVECMIVGCVKDGGEVKPVQPSNITPADGEKYKGIIEYVKDPANRADNDKVILIRFNQFNAVNERGEKVYHGNLGRDTASRVFMVRLRDVWGMSLKEAITYSGHKVDDRKTNETLFVWLYTPTAEGTITPATWKNILPNIDKLLK